MSGEIPLWPRAAPNVRLDSIRDMPALTEVVSPSSDKANGAAIILCPGGGYSTSTEFADKEGTQPARFFAQQGYVTFVLRYRCNEYAYPTPQLDGKRAIRHVRRHAKQWNINPGLIGMGGFSAGGHLASFVATHFDGGNRSSHDPVERESCRPDFLILAYPMITMREPHCYMPGRQLLLGMNPSPALIDATSNELRVTRETPITFISHGDSDKAVPIDNSVQFIQALTRAGVENHFMIMRGLDHSYGAEGKWQEACAAWLAGRILEGKT
jgi:acetyl esterase/lipase